MKLDKVLEKYCYLSEKNHAIYSLEWWYIILNLTKTDVFQQYQKFQNKCYPWLQHLSFSMWKFSMGIVQQKSIYMIRRNKEVVSKRDKLKWKLEVFLIVPTIKALVNRDSVRVLFIVLLNKKNEIEGFFLGKFPLEKKIAVGLLSWKVVELFWGTIQMNKIIWQ